MSNPTLTPLNTRTLTTQSRAYKNDALAALFIMNNVHYVQWSVESSPAALDLLGVAWLERHKDVVEEWGAAYHDATWMPLVHMLRVGLEGCERRGRQRGTGMVVLREGKSLPVCVKSEGWYAHQ